MSARINDTPLIPDAPLDPAPSVAANRPAIAAVRQGNPRGSGYVRAADSWYTEMPLDVDVLLDVENFPGLSWDPCCGGGNIPHRLTARGLACHGSDKVDRGAGWGVFDFLEPPHQYPRFDNLVTNPPFELAERIIARGFEIGATKIAILHRLAFLEGKARRRIHEEFGLSRVWVFSNRISMPPGDKPHVKAKGGAVAYCWLIYERGHRGPWHGGFIDSTGR